MIFSLPLLLHMVLPWHLLHNPWFQMLWSFPVYALGFYVFGRSAYQSIRNGVPNMDVLIVTGAIAAFSYSLIGTLMYIGTPKAAEFLFFETGSTIISLVLLGNLIEKRSVKQTAADMNAIQHLKVKTARKVEIHDGKEHIHQVMFDDIRMGDTFIVNEGDQIPIDGVIAQGEAYINEALLTGESVPVFRTTGGKVIGGTILSQGNCYVLATTDSKHSVVQTIIETVKKAQADKPPLQRLADKVSAVFVQVVIAIAMVTFLINWLVVDVGFEDAMMRAIAVLVISCPCAMGLATPTAVMAGIGKAARHGIVITKASALEGLAKAKTFLFDKTGTLTDGHFHFEIEMVTGEVDRELKNTIYNLEKYSSHPIARSVLELDHWFLSGIPFRSVQEIKGKGVEATAQDGNLWFFGTDETAATGLVLKRNNTIAAKVRITDQVKQGAGEVITDLNGLGITTVLISGDRKDKCDALLEQVPLTISHPEQSPTDKLKWVEKYNQREGSVMVGDGINDAPALSKSQVAISFGNATEIAQQSAQFILLKPDIKGVLYARIIADQTYRTIRQNLFWAFAYNVIAIPLAASGFMHPTLAAASMAFSDVVVIGNAIRLRYTKLGL